MKLDNKTIKLIKEACKTFNTEPNKLIIWAISVLLDNISKQLNKDIDKSKNN